MRPEPHFGGSARAQCATRVAQVPASNAAFNHCRSFAVDRHRHRIGTVERQANRADEALRRKAPGSRAWMRRRLQRRRRATCTGACANFDEDERAVALAADQIDLATARVGAACEPIIARHKRQAGALQMRPRAVLGAAPGRLARRRVARVTAGEQSHRSLRTCPCPPSSPRPRPRRPARSTILRARCTSWPRRSATWPT